MKETQNNSWFLFKASNGHPILFYNSETGEHRCVGSYQNIQVEQVPFTEVPQTSLLKVVIPRPKVTTQNAVTQTEQSSREQTQNLLKATITSSPNVFVQEDSGIKQIDPNYEIRTHALETSSSAVASNSVPEKDFQLGVLQKNTTITNSNVVFRNESPYLCQEEFPTTNLSCKDQHIARATDGSFNPPNVLYKVQSHYLTTVPTQTNCLATTSLQLAKSCSNSNEQFVSAVPTDSASSGTTDLVVKQERIEKECTGSLGITTSLKLNSTNEQFVSVQTDSASSGTTDLVVKQERIEKECTCSFGTSTSPHLNSTNEQFVSAGQVNLSSAATNVVNIKEEPIEKQCTCSLGAPTWPNLNSINEQFGQVHSSSETSNVVRIKEEPNDEESVIQTCTCSLGATTSQSNPHNRFISQSGETDSSSGTPNLVITEEPVETSECLIQACSLGTTTSQTTFNQQFVLGQWDSSSETPNFLLKPIHEEYPATVNSEQQASKNVDSFTLDVSHPKDCSSLTPPRHLYSPEYSKEDNDINQEYPYLDFTPNNQRKSQCDLEGDDRVNQEYFYLDFTPDNQRKTQSDLESDDRANQEYPLVNHENGSHNHVSDDRVSVNSAFELTGSSAGSEEFYQQGSLNKSTKNNRIKTKNSAKPNTSIVSKTDSEDNFIISSKAKGKPSKRKRARPANDADTSRDFVRNSKACNGDARLKLRNARRESDKKVKRKKKQVIVKDSQKLSSSSASSASIPTSSSLHTFLEDSLQSVSWEPSISLTQSSGSSTANDTIHTQSISMGTRVEPIDALSKSINTRPESVNIRSEPESTRSGSIRDIRAGSICDRSTSANTVRSLQNEDKVILEKLENKIDKELELNDLEHPASVKITEESSSNIDVEPDNVPTSSSECFSLVDLLPKKRRKREQKCNFCGAIFQRSTNVQRHVKFVHPEKVTDKILYTCSICSKGFILKNCLKKHMRTHSGEKPYRCPYCDRAFSQVQNLNKHKYIHTGQKPHKCDDCGKAFRQHSHLSRHRLIHTGEKPYQCGGCSRCYRTRSHLVRHLKSSRHKGIIVRETTKHEKSDSTDS